jgi:hypothetical protein
MKSAIKFNDVIVLLLSATLSFSCSKENDTPESSTIGKNLIPTFYWFDNLEGYGYDTEIIQTFDRLRKAFIASETIKTSDGFLKFSYAYNNNMMISFRGAEANALLSTFYKVNLSQMHGIGIDNNELISTIRNNKLWIGKFDTNTFFQTNYYSEDNNFPLEYIKKLENGESKKYELGTISAKTSNEKNCINLICEYDNNYDPLYLKTIYFINNKCHIPLNDSIGVIKSWYNGSYLVNYKTNNYKVFSDKAECIGSYKYSNTSLLDSFDRMIPINYTEYISFDSSVEKKTLTDCNKIIWKTNNRISIPIKASSKYELVSTENNIWKIKCNVTYSDKSTKDILFTINIDTGEMKLL